MNTAMRPDYFLNVPSLKRDEEAAKNGATEEERALYSMGLSMGWELFFQRAQSLLTDLDKVNQGAIANGAPLEQIGQNAVIISTARGIIERLLAVVADAKEACERPGNP